MRVRDDYIVMRIADQLAWYRGKARGLRLLGLHVAGIIIGLGAAENAKLDAGHAQASRS